MEVVTETDAESVEDGLTTRVPATETWRMESDTSGIAIWVSDKMLIAAAAAAARSVGRPIEVGDATLDGPPTLVVE